MTPAQHEFEIGRIFFKWRLKLLREWRVVRDCLIVSPVERVLSLTRSSPRKTTSTRTTFQMESTAIPIRLSLDPESQENYSSSFPARLEPEYESHTTTRIDDGGTEILLISSSDIEPKDILCLRGNGGIHNSANITFRQVISSNKPRFDSLPTPQEKHSFSANLWIHLRDNESHRFVRPAGGDFYEVLGYTKSVQKVQQALLSCRTTIVSHEPVIDDSACDLEEKLFDNIARVSLRTILARQEFVDAMQRKWGEDTVVKAQQFEDHVSSWLTQNGCLKFSDLNSYFTCSDIFRCYIDIGLQLFSGSKWMNIPIVLCKLS